MGTAEHAAANGGSVHFEDSSTILISSGERAGMENRAHFVIT